MLFYKNGGTKNAQYQQQICNRYGKKRDISIFNRFPQKRGNI